MNTFYNKQTLILFCCNSSYKHTKCTVGIKWEKQKQTKTKSLEISVSPAFTKWAIFSFLHQIKDEDMWAKDLWMVIFKIQPIFTRKRFVFFATKCYFLSVSKARKKIHSVIYNHCLKMKFNWKHCINNSNEKKNMKNFQTQRVNVLKVWQIKMVTNQKDRTILILSDYSPPPIPQYILFFIVVQFILSSF